MATSRLIVDPENLKRAEADNWALQFARIEWYFNFIFIVNTFVTTFVEIDHEIIFYGHFPPFH